MTVGELSAPCASSTPVKKTASAANDGLSTREAGEIKPFDFASGCNGADLCCGLQLDVFDSRGSPVEHDHNYGLMPIRDTSVCVKEEWDESLENLFATCDVDASFLAQSDSVFPAFLEEVINGDDNDDVPADDALMPAFQCDVTPVSPTAPTVPTVAAARAPAALRFKSSAGGAHTGAPCLFSCAGSTETRLSASCVSVTTTTTSPLTCLVSPSGSLVSAVSVCSPKGLSSAATESPICSSLLTSVDFSSTTESLFLSAPLAEIPSRAMCPMSRFSSSACSFSSCSSLSSLSSTTQRFLDGFSQARRWGAEVDRMSEETAEGVDGLDGLLRELPASLQDGEDEDDASGGRLRGNFPPTASSRPLERRARCREPRNSSATSRDPVLTSCLSHIDDCRPSGPLTEEDDMCLPLLSLDAEAGLLRLLTCDEDTLGHAIVKDDASSGPANFSSGFDDVVSDSITRESSKDCGAGTANDSPNCTSASTSLSRKRPRVEGDNSVLSLVFDCKKKCLDSSGFSDVALPSAFSSCSKEENEVLGDSLDGELSPQAQGLEKGGLELSSPKSRFLDFLSAFPESFDKNDKLRGGLLALSPCLPLGRNM